VLRQLTQKGSGSGWMGLARRVKIRELRDLPATLKRAAIVTVAYFEAEPEPPRIPRAPEPRSGSIE
jgi:hypothetical protein